MHTRDGGFVAIAVDRLDQKQLMNSCQLILRNSSVSAIAIVHAANNGRGGSRGGGIRCVEEPPFLAIYIQHSALAVV